MIRILTIALMLVCTLMMKAQIDVDNDIAVNDQNDPNTFVLIISNENYKYEQQVPFALNDGRIFKLYCEKTLGIPAKNIRYSSAYEHAVIGATPLPQLEPPLKLKRIQIGAMALHCGSNTVTMFAVTLVEKPYLKSGRRYSGGRDFFT